MSTAVVLLAELAARGIELRAEGEQVQFRPIAAMTPELAERVKQHKSEVLALLNETPTGEDAESRADREIRRFLWVAISRPDGRGWYDPATPWPVLLQLDAAGQAMDRKVKDESPKQGVNGGNS
jgi:hypothetical protein